MTQPPKRKLPRNRKDKVVFWTAAVQACERSGLTQQEFCKAQGLCPSTFRYWKKELSAKGAVPPKPAQELVPVPVTIQPPSFPKAESSGSISLTVRDRYLLDIPDGFQAATLEQILLVLENVS